MNSKSAIAAVVIVALAITLIVIKVVDNKRHDEDTAQIESQSNSIVTYKANLDEAQQVNVALSNNLASTTADYSNKLEASQFNLRATQASLDKTEADARAAAETASNTIATQEKQIADLEAQNQELDKKAADLGAAIVDRENQINTVQKKLDASEGDRAFLLLELKRLKAEKADLESKLNDLSALRAQVRTLKDELSISHKLDLLRQKIYETFTEPGATNLGKPPPMNTNVNLNVELREHGPDTVISNAPAK